MGDFFYICIMGMRNKKDLTEQISKLIKLRFKCEDEIKIQRNYNNLKRDYDYRIIFIIKLGPDDGILSRINKGGDVLQIRYLLKSVLNLKENNVFVINTFKEYYTEYKLC
jgi:hypothetical protein